MKNETPDSTALTPNPSIAVPSTLSPSVDQFGREQLDFEDIEIPKVEVVQFSSKVAKAEPPDRIELGTLINSVSHSKLDGVFLPLFRYVDFVKWNPKNKQDPNFDSAFDPGQRVFSSSNPRDPRVFGKTEFGPNGETPEVERRINFLCFFPSSPDMPLILTFKKTSYNEGKKFSTMTLHDGYMFARKYQLKWEQEDKGKGHYYKHWCVPAGISSTEEMAAAKKWFDLFIGKKIKVHDEVEVEKTGEGFSD